MTKVFKPSLTWWYCYECGAVYATDEEFKEQRDECCVVWAVKRDEYDEEESYRGEE